MGAFVEEIRQGSVAAQLLGELKAGKSKEVYDIS